MEWNSDSLKWMGIALCITQSATFSGLNLALFGLSRLRLEVEADGGNRKAAKLLEFRRDSNYLLATILWGNVGVNCLLTILSDSLLTGLMAFLFSTVVITIVGEIVPQAYFSRHALKMVELMSPLLNIYMLLLFPVVKPSAMILNAWLGPEGIQYYREQDLHAFLKKHIAAHDSDVSLTEGLGALNFLHFDDLPIVQEGEPLHPQSIIRISRENNRPMLPPFERKVSDPFLSQLQASGMKWVILIDQDETPLLALDAEAFLQGALYGGESFNPYWYCHRPIVSFNPQESFASLVPRFKVHATHAEDDVIDDDLILLWGKEKRIITGSDILGRLLRGIVTKTKAPSGLDGNKRLP